jgi:hypothetical protein
MSVRPLLALVLGIVTAAVIGCGGSSNLLSSADSAGLKDELSSVQTALDNGKCAQATQAAARFETAARNLPTSVDTALRANLRQGANQLVTQVSSDCRGQRTVTTETTTTPDTTPTTTTPTTPTTTTAPIPTIPETLPTTPTTTSNGTGGTGAGGLGGGGTP